MDNEKALHDEQRLMRMMRKTLTSIVRDTAPRNGHPSPLSEATVLGIKDCLMVISVRETELSQLTGRTLDERPHFTDDTPNSHAVKISSIPKKSH
ncbi:hypothetical protein [Thiobacillus sp.]|uniref:hypothetical protein n=1 Tax=Thiobacillus sp. TaxID=924 RepID=UPI00286D8AA3|nr:hypothetical protein [Thiobacillus sp.]